MKLWSRLCGPNVGVFAQATVRATRNWSKPLVTTTNGGFRSRQPSPETYATMPTSSIWVFPELGEWHVLFLAAEVSPNGSTNQQRENLMTAFTLERGVHLSSSSLEAASSKSTVEQFYLEQWDYSETSCSIPMTPTMMQHDRNWKAPENLGLGVWCFRSVTQPETGEV